MYDGAEQGASITDALEAAVKKILVASASHPIVGADKNGAFPPATFGSLLLRSCFVVVPDANYLIRDIANGCKSGRRVLVTAANNGSLRLFCAPHVITEVDEKSEAAAARAGVSVESYIERWETEYLPLIRVIEEHELLTGLLTRQERSRLDLLKDRDDIPSATIAISLNAFYLTWDKAAFDAVYGRRPDASELIDQIKILMDGGRSGKMAEMFILALLLPAAAIQGVTAAYANLARAFPLTPWVLGAAAAFIAMRTPAERYHSFGLTALKALQVTADLYRPYQEALDRFEQSGPGEPDWTQVSHEVHRRAVLARAALYTLARAPEGTMSARRLAEELPELRVGQSEKPVRETLRSWACFVETYPGQFQVGRPVDHTLYESRTCPLK